jgi:hypothetical protein
MSNPISSAAEIVAAAVADGSQIKDQISHYMIPGAIRTLHLSREQCIATFGEECWETLVKTNLAPCEIPLVDVESVLLALLEGEPIGDEYLDNVKRILAALTYHGTFYENPDHGEDLTGAPGDLERRIGELRTTICQKATSGDKIDVAILFLLLKQLPDHPMVVAARNRAIVDPSFVTINDRDWYLISEQISCMSVDIDLYSAIVLHSIENIDNNYTYYELDVSRMPEVVHRAVLEQFAKVNPDSTSELRWKLAVFLNDKDLISVLSTLEAYLASTVNWLLYACAKGIYSELDTLEMLARYLPKDVRSTEQWNQSSIDDSINRFLRERTIAIAPELAIWLVDATETIGASALAAIHATGTEIPESTLLQKLDTDALNFYLQRPDTPPHLLKLLLKRLSNLDHVEALMGQLQKLELSTDDVFENIDLLVAGIENTDFAVRIAKMQQPDVLIGLVGKLLSKHLNGNASLNDRQMMGEQRTVRIIRFVRTWLDVILHDNLHNKPHIDGLGMLKLLEHRRYIGIEYGKILQLLPHHKSNPDENKSVINNMDSNVIEELPPAVAAVLRAHEILPYDEGYRGPWNVKWDGGDCWHLLRDQLVENWNKRIIIVHQQVNDGGGPSKEFYSLLGKELTDSHFTAHPTEVGLLPRPDASAKDMYMIGRLLYRAIHIDRQQLNLDLHPAIWTLLAAPKIALGDLNWDTAHDLVGAEWLSIVAPRAVWTRRSADIVGEICRRYAPWMRLIRHLIDGWSSADPHPNTPSGLMKTVCNPEADLDGVLKRLTVVPNVSVVNRHALVSSYRQAFTAALRGMSVEKLQELWRFWFGTTRLREDGKDIELSIGNDRDDELDDVHEQEAPAKSWTCVNSIEIAHYAKHVRETLEERTLRITQAIKLALENQQLSNSAGILYHGE